jgi:hypothetical protein
VKPSIEAQLGGQLETTGDGEPPSIPPVLTFRGEQLGRVMSRAKQMSQRVSEIEKYVKKRARELATGYNKRLPLALVMSDSEFARWTFCVEASRRADESADRLLKSLREEMDHLRSAGTPDLVAQLARAEEPPAEDPPDEQQPPVEDPPVKESPDEPGKPAPMKSAETVEPEPGGESED